MRYKHISYFTQVNSTHLQDISDTMRETIARVCNCITLLAKFNFQITDTLIVLTYDFALQYGVRDILVDECAEQIANAVKNQMDVMNMVE